MENRMKIYFIVTCCCFLISCGKDYVNYESTFSTSAKISLAGNPNSTQWLSFSSVKEYENLISGLNNASDSLLLAFDSINRFSSLLSTLTESQLDSLGLYDMTLAAILSPNCRIQIEDYIFDLDFASNNVSVSNIQLHSIDSYGFDDDVISLIFYNIEDELDDIDTRSGQNYSCSYTGEFCALQCENVKIKLIYQRAGIYHSLLGKISRSGVYLFDGPFDIKLETNGGHYTKKGSNDITYFPSVVRGGDGRKYIYCPYQGVRALKKFDWNCKFYAEDPSNINNYLLKDFTIYKY